MIASKFPLSALLFLLPAAFCLAQQEIRVTSFGKEQFDVSQFNELDDEIKDVNGEPCALIKVGGLFSDSVIFGPEDNVVKVVDKQMGKWWIYMVDGSKELTIDVQNYPPLKCEFQSEAPEVVRLKKKYVYSLSLCLPSARLRVLLVPQFGLPVSFGLMAGLVKKNAGGYLRAKTNFQNASKSYGCDRAGQTGENGKLWLTGASRRTRWALTGGYIHHLVKPLYLYGGVGYGQSLLLWDCADSRPAEVDRVSSAGVAAELGALLCFGRFAATLGVQTTAFRTMELNVGVGLLF